MRLSAILSVLLVLAGAGCSLRSDPPQPPSAAEQRQLDYLCRDPEVQIIALQRDSDNNLRVRTRQGDQERRYVIGPVEPNGPPRLRPLAETIQVPIRSIPPDTGERSRGVP